MTLMYARWPYRVVVLGAIGLLLGSAGLPIADCGLQIADSTPGLEIRNPPSAIRNGEAAPASYEQALLPFLRQYCTACHGNGAHKGDFTSMVTATRPRSSATVWSGPRC
jgi:mono/diheme cytochrome c family protein